MPPARAIDRHDPDDNKAAALRPATPRQLRALGAIARARGVGPEELLAGRGLDAGSLTAAEASRLISGLRSAAAG